MHFDWSTLVLQTINFAILVWLLHRFLYRPVLRTVDARRAEIDRLSAQAGAAEAKAKEQLAAIEAERKGIAAERIAALKTAAAQAEEAAVARHAQAERDATALLDATRKTLAVERNQALAELRQRAFDLAADIAGRVLAEAPEKQRADGWLERIARHLADLPGAERDALTRQLADGAPLTVVTASALLQGIAESWRAQLHRSLGDRIAIAFDTDAQLVAGAELHFPNAVLRFSWQSELAAMRTAMEPHDIAR